ncbi:MAG: N-acetyl-gamma-glutamyl-phosphate reductase [Balneolales bacterium]
MKEWTVSVAGASGYAGLEAVRLLSVHPHAKLNRIYSESTAGQELADLYPGLGKVGKETLLPMSQLDEDDSDIIILGLPHGVSAAVVQQLLSRGYEGKIIDIGSDLRLRKSQLYEEYYGYKHQFPELLDWFDYGLTEFYPDDIKKAQFVANPGCFATAMQLAIWPLVKHNIADSFTVNGMTGSSGSGAKASKATHFSSRFGNVSAYKVFEHQHLGEVYQSLERVNERKPAIHFIPLSGPFVRGIWMNIAFSCDEGTNLEAIYQDTFAECPLVRLTNGLPQLKSVVGSAYSDIGWVKRGNHAVVGVAIDNLIKGAAGQAIQNMNLMFGVDEDAGLLTPPLIL